MATTKPDEVSGTDAQTAPDVSADILLSSSGEDVKAVGGKQVWDETAPNPNARHSIKDDPTGAKNAKLAARSTKAKGK